jgi:hypothetical protein
MKFPMLFAALLAMAGCDQSSSKTANPASPHPAAQDHWVIVPNPSPTVEAVWKLNTQTGELEFCFNTGVVKCNREAATDPAGEKLLDKVFDGPQK